ncbi:MAG: type II toxin-antitoxin system RelB/DinJ family antitoxin [Chloroflexota bacterium]|nr:type II toxin-antitoxin system RelB/DinJ family antitoxin [Chloroflexota bacterium]
MAATAIVQARVEPALKEEATLIFEAIGLTPSEAVRLFLTRVVAEKAFPMELLVPNEASLDALREAREGRLHSAATFDEMLAELNAGG